MDQYTNIISALLLVVSQWRIWGSSPHYVWYQVTK